MGCLDGKSVVITGAGRGLGAAYARLAAAEGARVVVNDIDGGAAEAVAAAIRDGGGAAAASDADVSDWDASAGLIALCERRFGPVDGLVNNAGVFHMAAPEDEERASVERIIRVNVNGTVNCGLHALAVMKRRGRGAILNVTSGAHAGYARMAVYGATKGAAASLTYGWACDMAGTEIRVNAIAPIARTRMYDQMLETGDTRREQTGLTVSPDENAAIAIYLLSDMARDVNGQIVRVDIPRLSLMTHPSELPPPAERTEWTVDAVHAAFGSVFRSRLQPLGLHRGAGADTGGD